jgi:hypothetical protein
MSIINQKYLKIIKKSIKSAFRDALSLKSVDDYLDFIQGIDDLLLRIATQSIASAFEAIDRRFKDSKRRKQLYYTKGRYRRTIMTLFGEVSFEREYYVPKGSDTGGFFYVDRLFSLPKHDYYDPMIKAYIIEYSASQSYGQTGEIVGDKIGERFKSLADKRFSSISRQTVYNVVKQAEMDTHTQAHKDDVKTLYVQLDEKWVHTQNNDHRMKEIKAAVIYTDIEETYKGRKRLVGRHVLTSDKSASDLRRKLLDYINHTYDVDKLRHIILSGDGANWINMSAIDLTIQSSIKTIVVLDRFHMYQAINHISKDPSIKHRLREYLKSPKTKLFRELCHILIRNQPHRESIIAQKRDYLLSNWRFIKHQSHPLFKGCSMEGHISHVLASLFTSRPKAHGLPMITKRLKIRQHHVNRLDLKEIYLSNHVRPVFKMDHVEPYRTYPRNLFDVIGHKMTGRYNMFKSIAHPRVA